MLVVGIREGLSGLIDGEGEKIMIDDGLLIDGLIGIGGDDGGMIERDEGSVIFIGRDKVRLGIDCTNGELELGAVELELIEIFVDEGLG